VRAFVVASKKAFNVKSDGSNRLVMGVVQERH